MTAKTCRTCGFTDCPGATTGDCPRWPARETASDLDRFSTDQLERMHHRVFNTGTVLYQRAMSLIERQRQLPPDDFEAYSAGCSEIATMLAAGAENHELLVSVGGELRRRQNPGAQNGHIDWHCMGCGADYHGDSSKHVCHA